MSYAYLAHQCVKYYAVNKMQKRNNKLVQWGRLSPATKKICMDIYHLSRINKKIKRDALCYFLIRRKGPHSKKISDLKQTYKTQDKKYSMGSPYLPVNDDTQIDRALECMTSIGVIRPAKGRRGNYEFVEKFEPFFIRETQKNSLDIFPLDEIQYMDNIVFYGVPVSEYDMQWGVREAMKMMEFVEMSRKYQQASLPEDQAEPSSKVEIIEYIEPPRTLESMGIKTQLDLRKAVNKAMGNIVKNYEDLCVYLKKTETPFFIVCSQIDTKLWGPR